VAKIVTCSPVTSGCRQESSRRSAQPQTVPLNRSRRPSRTRAPCHARPARILQSPLEDARFAYEELQLPGNDLRARRAPRSLLWRGTSPGHSPGTVPVSARPAGADVAEWTAGIDEEGTVTASRETGRRSIASNRRARNDYTILKTYEAGIVLVGNEVKSLRAGHASLAGAFVQEHDGELMLHGLHISEHAHGRHGTRVLYQPRRTRKLLMHRSEIDKIIARLGDAGVTLVPLSLYFQDGWAKVEIALARGRRSFDKRQAIAQRDADREIARELSDRLRGRRRRGRGPS
jgi:SsrA-binding protein